MMMNIDKKFEERYSVPYMRRDIYDKNSGTFRCPECSKETVWESRQYGNIDYHQYDDVEVMCTECTRFFTLRVKLEVKE